MGIETRQYAFNDATAPSAADPETMIEIENGVHPVIFDDMVSVPGVDLECEIRPTGLAFRILRTSLAQLVEDGKARLIGGV